MKKIHNWLRLKRLGKELSQVELAYAIGQKSHSYISQWESGLGKPSDEQCAAIAGVLECSVQDIWPEEEA